MKLAIDFTDGHHIKMNLHDSMTPWVKHVETLAGKYKYSLNDGQSAIGTHESPEVYKILLDTIKKLQKNRFFAVSTKASIFYNDLQYKKGDVFIFGPETRGLPNDILNSELNEEKIRVPMTKNNRSLNLSNTVAIVLYEAWRQNKFKKGI